jgi:hypothetical protein
LQRAWAAPQLGGEASQREAVWRVRGNARQHTACHQAKPRSFNEAHLFAIPNDVAHQNGLTSGVYSANQQGTM